MKEPQFTIAAVERDVGLSKDVLRVWERRYGCPLPERDAHGERLYPAGQVLRLRLIKRLMDQGHRPGRLMAASVEALEALAAGARAAGGADSAAGSTGPDGGHELLQLIRQHQAAAYLQAMQQRLARQGLRLFVQDTVAPLTLQVGLAWEQGRLQVFEEHLFTELTARVLRQAVAAVPGGTEPRVLLTTLPKEPHGIGLLMVEAVLALEGAQCIPLGMQTPLLEIVDAAAAHRADVVALSFSAAFPVRQVPALLEQLRAALPETTELWAGGAGVQKLAPPQGVACMASLDSAIAAVNRWRHRPEPADS
jgi:methanogenic corrinoid protein MtbC1